MSSTSNAGAAAALREEIALAHEWVEAAFAKSRTPAGPRVAAMPTDVVIVLRKSHKVLKNRTVWDTPLTLGDKQYAHGIFMDAPAAVRVRLSWPAVEFTARVGIDNNQSTRGKPEAGSARFHVIVNGKKVFSTPTTRTLSSTTASPIFTLCSGVWAFSLSVIS